MIRFETLTEQQLQALTDTTVTTQQAVELIGCGQASVVRWRKRLGVKMKMGAPTGERPYRIKRETRVCPCCNTSFTCRPSERTRHCSMSCAMKLVDKSYMQTEAYKDTLRKPHTEEYKKYRRAVAKFTEKVYLQHKDVINPNDYPRTLNGVEGGWQLDHIKPVIESFHEGESPEFVSRLENLRMLPWKENLTR